MTRARTPHLRRGQACRLAACLGAAWLAALSGCASTHGTQEALPPVHPSGRTIDPPVNPNLPVARATVYVQQVVLPLNRPTDVAWEMIDEDAFPTLTRSVWNANGLRIGILPRNQVASMIRRLPVALATQQQKLIASEHPVPIRHSPTLHEAVLVDLTIPPLAVREDRAIGGRAQLLLSVDADRTLILTPHHYKPRPRLLPATALEKELDGRVYHEIALAMALDAQEVLVLGLHRPWPLLPPPTEDDQADEANEADPTAPETAESDRTAADPFAAYDLSNPPALFNDLGRALFAGVAAGRDVQVMLLITLEPVGVAERPF